MKRVLVVGVLLVVIAAGGAEVPAGFQKGMTWGFAARPGFFASEEARKDVDEMFATGVRWIVLTPNVWQSRRSSRKCTRQAIIRHENVHGEQLFVTKMWYNVLALEVIWSENALKI